MARASIHPPPVTPYMGHNYMFTFSISNFIEAPIVQGLQHQIMITNLSKLEFTTHLCIKIQISLQFLGNYKVRLLAKSAESTYV